MAHGKSILMRYIGRDGAVKAREIRPRDRSLNGKARIRARKAANKAS